MNQEPLQHPDGMGTLSQEHGQSALRFEDETEKWAGRPSQWVNAMTFFYWIIFLIGAPVFWYLWDNRMIGYYSPLVDQYIHILVYSLMGMAVFCMLMAYLSVRNELTVITANKICETRGISVMLRRNLYCEISDIQDIQSPPAGVLGLIGISTLVIHTHDSDQPMIRIRGLRHRERLVSILHPLWRQLKVERRGYFN